MWNPRFFLICTSTLFFFLSVYFTTTLLPLYMRDAGFHEGMIGFVFGVGAVSALVGRLISGWAIDLWGTGAFLVAGALMWVVVTPLVAFTANVVLLIFYRLFHGVGIGIFMNASLGYVTYVTPASHRGTAISWWGMMNNLAVALGPVAVAFLLLKSDFTIAFLVAGMMAVVALVLSLVLTPTQMSNSSSHPPLNNNHSQGHLTDAPNGTTSVSSLHRDHRHAALQCAQGKACVSSKSPPSPPSGIAVSHSKIKLYTSSAVLPGWIGSALGFSGGAFIVFSPLRAQEIGISNVGLFLSVYAVGMILARLAVGPISDKKGRSWTIIPGLVLLMISMFLMGFVEDSSLAIIVSGLFGLGTGSALPGLIAWAVDRSDASERTLAGSTFYSFYEIGLFLGATVLGQLIETASYASFLVVGVVLTVALVGYIYGLKAEKRSHGPKSARS